MDSLILVDTSYTSFYRFFATLRWFSLNQPEIYKEKKLDPSYDWSENEIFIEKYKKMFLESIIKLVSNKVYKKSKVIFCLDTPKKDLWRNAIMKNYKAGRADLSLKANFKPTFELTYKKLIPQLIKENPDKIFKLVMDCIEADDVIGIISKYYEKKDPNKNIYVVSGDNDFLQLGRPNLYICNYKNKKPVLMTKEEANIALLTKIVLGDSSDNIPSIFVKKITAKKKKELIENEKLLKEYMDENKEVKEQYEINEKMIDFNYIPQKLQSALIESFMQLY